MFRKLTKWIPLGNYMFGSSDMIVFVRGNKKTGMMYFKVKKVQRLSFSNNFIPVDLINVREAWEKINKEINLK